MGRERISGRKLYGLAAIASLVVGITASAPAQPEARSTLNVVVTDAETGKPINQARLTLVFQEPRPSWMKPKANSYYAKSNAQGHCRFALVPKGTVRLMVTAEQHESLGKVFDFHQDDQVIQVKLKKPQPLL